MTSVRRRATSCVGLCLLIAMACGCSGGDGRGTQRITGWSAADAELQLWIDTCNGDPETTTTESEDEVVITVTSTRQRSGDDCQDVVTVVLSEPLMDRAVVDGKTGRAAPSMEG